MPHPGGRPTLYREEYCDKLIAAMYEGKSVERFCRDIRVCKDTFYEWVKKHTLFADAFKLGRTDCEAYWEEWLVNRLESKDVNSNLVKLFMTNRFGWGDKHDLSAHVAVDDTTNKLVEHRDRYGAEYGFKSS